MNKEKTTAGLVLGILSLCFFWLTFLCMPLSILAIVFGGLGIKNNKEYGYASLIMGCISLFLIIIILFFALG